MSYNSTTELDIGPAKEGLSALFGVILSPEPRPDTIQTTSSPLHELRALNHLNTITAQHVDLEVEPVKPQIIKPWRPEMIPPSYTFISFIIPILSIYAIVIPTTFRCLLHGKIVARNTITVVTSFIAFTFSLKTIHLFIGSHMISVTFAALIAFLTALVALTPLKYLGFRITNLGKQPIGWIIMTLFYTLLVANIGIHFGAELFRVQNGNLSGDDTVIISIPYYPLLLIILALIVMVIIVTNITAVVAQNAVLMTISAYIIVSGLVLVYNVLFVRYISHDSPTQLDPSSFFSKNVSVSMRKNTSLALIVLVSILSTKYHTEIDLAREAIIHPHEQRD